jgi:transcriptional activator SPT7
MIDLTPITRVKPTEPPPPFPPPPPFVPLNFAKVDDQIGLLKPFYQQRFAALSTVAPVQPPPLPGPNIGVVPIPAPPAIAATPSPLAILPDDPAEPSHIKMGPLGQIVKGSSATGGSKKKLKRKDVGDGETGTRVVGAPGTGEPPAKKKKVAGNGLGGKKKVKMAEPLPPVILASA